MSEVHLEISRVSIEFPTPKGPFCALKDVDLKINKGEFVSLIGHSGCGKSTVLNIVAGLYRATAGGIMLNGREVKPRSIGDQLDFIAADRQVAVWYGRNVDETDDLWKSVAEVGVSRAAITSVPARIHCKIHQVGQSQGSLV